MQTYMHLYVSFSYEVGPLQIVVLTKGEKLVNLCAGIDSPYRGTSLIRKRPPPQDPPRTLGIGLQWGPRWVHSLISEVPLYSLKPCEDDQNPTSFFSVSAWHASKFKAYASLSL